MSTIVRCEGCGKQLRLSERMAGRRVACPACRTPISVPQAFSSPSSDASASETSTPLPDSRPKAPSRKHPGSTEPGSSDSISPIKPVPQTKSGQSRVPKERSPDASPDTKPTRISNIPRGTPVEQQQTPVAGSDDPFDFSSSVTATGADRLAADSASAIEMPVSGVSISGVSTGVSKSSVVGGRRSKKKNSSQKQMLQYGIGFATIVVVLLAILFLSQDDGEAHVQLKALVQDQFYDCKDQKLLNKIIEKHHMHCVDASIKESGNVDADKYAEMMRKRVAKDLRAQGHRY